MKTITVQIPDSLDEREAKTILAARLYEKGSLSLGQTAELAGYTKRTVMEVLGNYNVSVFSYAETELEKDILDAQNYHFFKFVLQLIPFLYIVTITLFNEEY